MKKRKGITMPISIKLKEILKERDLSQRELARMIGLRHNTISHLCSDNVDRVYLSTHREFQE